jgi:hypothetical protein
MAAKPPISVRRPVRPATEALQQQQPIPISRAPVPNVDPNGPEALAFAMRGRISSSSPTLEGEGPAGSDAPITAMEPSASASNRPIELPAMATVGAPSRLGPDERLEYRHIQGAVDEVPLVSVKLPPKIGRCLAAVADRRGSKRTIVAIEVLTEPLRELAAEHRAGRFPELPRVVAGTVRSSIAFALPPDLAADLAYVLRERRAVRAQVITRLLVPAIERIYATEIGGGEAIDRFA